MEKNTIYYLSGAGNSLAVAKKLAGDLGMKCLPITKLLASTDSGIEDLSHVAEDRIDGNRTEQSSIVGFVFPVHGGAPPKLVRQILETLHPEDLGDAYTFAVCTYGISPGKALLRVKDILKARGGELSLGYGVEMPQSGIGSARISWTIKEDLWEKGREKTARISAALQERRKGLIESMSTWGPMFNRKNRRMFPAVFKMLPILIFKGARGLTQTADDKCTGCGICARICPVGCITMEDGMPQWGKECIGCFGCYHWCPEEAVSFGGYHFDSSPFHHPDITAADMFLRT